MTVIASHGNVPSAVTNFINAESSVKQCDSALHVCMVIISQRTNLWKHQVNLLLQSIISTDQDPSLRIELMNVSTKLYFECDSSTYGLVQHKNDLLM